MESRRSNGVMGRLRVTLRGEGPLPSGEMSTRSRFRQRTARISSRVSGRPEVLQSSRESPRPATSITYVSAPDATRAQNGGIVAILKFGDSMQNLSSTSQLGKIRTIGSRGGSAMRNRRRWAWAAGTGNPHVPSDLPVLVGHGTRTTKPPTRNRTRGIARWSAASASSSV